MTNEIQFKNISKVFPGVKALDNITFSASSGKVLAFLGENGAGKSTLLKIMSGDYKATSGDIVFNDEKKEFKSPKEAIDFGISVIYQERQILLELSVAENIYLGRLPKYSNGLINENKLIEDTKKIIKEFDLDINPKTKVKDLNVAHQQMVEIMKTYSRNPKLIAFDEPTASLSDQEINALFKVIRKLKTEGKIIIYVSHRMKELREICDEVVIFKDGKYVDKRDLNNVEDNELITLMVGRDLGDIFKDLNRNDKFGENVLEVKSLSNRYIENINFNLRRGEILGFSGLVGAGRTEVMRAILGIDKVEKGSVCIEGKELNLKKTNPKSASQEGIVMVPEDRKLEGILSNMTVGDNISISLLDKISNKFGFINFTKEKEIIQENIKSFNIKTPYPEKLILELSGGNQQKAIIARWLATNPKVLILDEPTKGIDIGAKSELYNLICEVVKKGVSVILISSELPEVIGLSDRIIVMREGKITGEVNREQATEDVLLEYAMLG